MRLISHRNRSRRSSRFVPSVDGLAPRITPVCIAPIDCPLTDVPIDDVGTTETTETTDSDYVMEHDPAFEEMMADVILELEKLCRTTPADV